ncbi:reverse transcriptase domain-containing protein [Tanacetum coccineum]
MHTRASNSELVEPLPEPERTLNRRLRRRNRRVPYDQRNNPPQHPRIVADHVVAPHLGSASLFPETANEFAIKGNHLTLVKGNQFDGRTKTDPHKHIHEFLGICDMFKYRDTENEVVRLMMFPLSLTREAKTWLDELNEGTIETWDELRTAFISRFFPPALFDRLLGEIRAFSQHENESLTDAWLRMKEMLQNCHGHNLSKGNIIKIFYHGLSEITQEVLNAAAGGIFLYKTPNQAYQLLEDKVLLKLDWAKNQKTKTSLKKTVAFADEGSSNSNTDKIMARMDAMTLKMDAQYKELQNHAKKTKPDEDDIPISQEEEAKFMQTFQTFMDLKTQLETVAKNHQASIQNLETKFDRLADKQSGRPSGSLPSNTQPNPKGHNSKAYQPPQSRNEHVNAVFTRSGKSYNPSVNPNDQQNDSETPINFDSDDEDEESTPQPVGNTKSVGHFQSPLVWPSNQLRMSNKAKENMLTYSAEAIQADCDIKAINIILQGLPTEIYALFTYKKGETLHEYYLRFTLLLNDMNIYKMPLEQFQVNTKFLNTLPNEWSKFVTDVKLVKDLHTTNVDQLHAHLQQHERHVIEVRLMHERNPDPLALVASHQLTQPAYQSHLHPHQQSLSQHHISPYQSSQFVTPYQHQQFSTNQSTPLSITYPTNEYQSTVHHNVYSQQLSIPQLEYAPTTYQQQQPEFSQPDSSLVVPVFQKGDDPIDAINHMMSFLTAVVTSRYPTTNNSLRTSSKTHGNSYHLYGKVDGATCTVE